MTEPTEEQLKILHKDIMSGLVMTIEVEQYTYLTDKLKSCYERIKELEAEIQEVSNHLSNLYNECNETTSPEVYGTILGLHERLEQALKRRLNETTTHT